MRTVNRRYFTLGAMGVAAANVPASAWQHPSHTRGGAARYEHFDASTAREVEALTSQIIPSDGAPGAREAGVIYFIDRALKTWESDKREAYREGLAGVQQLRRKLFPTSSSVAALDPEQVRQLISAIEKTPFFELLRTHTVLGFLGPPSYGGNRGGAGWALIGFEDRMTFQPPFGYYDAEALKESKP